MNPAPALASVPPHAVWLFGRSGAGKTTLARRLRDHWKVAGRNTFLLDGDDIRSGLAKDLGFSPGDRLENHRRIAEVAKLAAMQGILPIVATMAPEFAQRDVARAVLGTGLVWVWIDAPLDVCARRDPKGLYRRAARGEIHLLTEYPFDPPRADEAASRVDTSVLDVDSTFHELIRLIETAPGR